MAPERTSRSGRRARLVVAVMAAAIGLAACGSSSSGAASPANSGQQALALTGGRATLGQLSITGAYIPDPATPSLAAAYFTVSNAGPADRLLSISTSEFRSALLNRYVSHPGGSQSMVGVPKGAVVPAHGRLVLKPGSFHVMLRHPTHPLRQGMDARLTLRFQRAGQVSLVVPIVALTGLAGASGSTSMPGMDMSGDG